VFSVFFPTTKRERLQIAIKRETEHEIQRHSPNVYHVPWLVWGGGVRARECVTRVVPIDDDITAILGMGQFRSG